MNAKRSDSPALHLQAKIHQFTGPISFWSENIWDCLTHTPCSGDPQMFSFAHMGPVRERRRSHLLGLLVCQVRAPFSHVKKPSGVWTSFYSNCVLLDYSFECTLVEQMVQKAECSSVGLDSHSPSSAYNHLFFIRVPCRKARWHRISCTDGDYFPTIVYYLQTFGLPLQLLHYSICVNYLDIIGQNEVTFLIFAIKVKENIIFLVTFHVVAGFSGVNQSH